MVNFTLWQFYARERTSVPIELEAGWAPEPIWTFRKREKSLDSIGIRTPDRQLRSLVTKPTELSRLQAVE
jgi:hypothetical protein